MQGLMLLILINIISHVFESFFACCIIKQKMTGYCGFTGFNGFSGFYGFNNLLKFD
jgi:hypothetical protein